jgi:uncharacterized protein DUF4397
MVLLCAAMLASCDKNAVQDITAPHPAGARIKFFHFGVNAPGVNFYANNAKMTAISSTTCATLTDANREMCTTVGAESTTGVVFGGAGSGGFYSAIEPGQYTLAGKIAAATDKDLAISNVQATVADGKFYSYYLSGIYNTTARTVDAFVVEDALPASIDYAVAHVRFVNAISNSNAMTLFARHSVSGAESAVGGAVTYKGAGAFVALPPGVYDVSTREAGSATNVITRTTLSFESGRVYTISSRGDMTVTSGTAATRPQLDYTPNR